MKKIFLLALSSVFCFAATPMLADDNNNVVNPDTEKYLSLDAIGNTETASLLELIPVRYVLRPAESIEIGTDSGKVVIGSPETVTREQFGLIAQDLKNIFPTLVYEIGNGEYGINYTGLIPVLIQSVKALVGSVLPERIEAGGQAFFHQGFLGGMPVHAGCDSKGLRSGEGITVFHGAEIGVRQNGHLLVQRDGNGFGSLDLYLRPERSAEGCI